MAILHVGPTSSFASIADALSIALTGDVIALESGYGNENAVVTVDGLSFDGGSSSTGIDLQLGTGITAITLLGSAPINVMDGPDANTIVGNDGDNVISVSSGVDVVNGGNGTDRLIIDYAATTAPVTGTLGSVTDGGTHAVTFTNVENLTITTGSGNDTLTVGDGSNVVSSGAGDDTITVGNGPNIIDGGAGNDTITAGSGANTIDGGSGNDTIIAGDGGNTINGGPGDDGITTGAGNDIITTGLGNDTVTAGGGADVTTVNGGIDTVDSGSGNDRLIVDFSSSTTAVNGGVTGGTLAGGYDGAFADGAGTSSVVFQGTENFTVTTGSANDVISTGDGNDVLDGGAGSDQLNSGGGNDTLLIGLGSDALDGGAGIDAAIFSAPRADYQITDLGGGVVQSIDLRAGSPDGTDTLVNIEGFVFTDGTFDATTVLNNPPTLGGDLGIAVPNGGSVIVTAADLTATDADSTNAQLVYTVTGALHGAVLLNGVAAASFTEADILANAVSFQHDGSATNGSFTVSLTDGTATPQTATVLAAVDLPGNNPPVLGGDLGIAVPNGGAVVVTTVDLTATDSDNTNAQLVYTVTGAVHGSVLLGGVAAASFTEADLVANAISFQHDGSATDGSFTVSLTDGTAAPQMATVIAAVDLPGNNPPVLGGDLGIAVANGGAVVVTTVDLTATDSDNTDAQLVYTVTGALHGTVLLGGVAAATFTEADLVANAVSFQHDGSDTNGDFTVSLTDGTAAPQMATVTAVVDLGNDAPVATNGSASGNEDTVISGTVPAASDPDNTAGPLSYALTGANGGAAHGTVTLHADGTFAYTPDQDYSGADSFSFHANDGSLDSNNATESLTIGPTNDPPVVTGSITLPSIMENSGAVHITQGELLANASDADGPSLSAINLAIASGDGTLVNNNDGTWSYTPAHNDDTSVSFSYQVTDGVAAPVADSAALDIAPLHDWHAVGQSGVSSQSGGLADIVWQNDSGQAGTWLMNGVTPAVQVNIGDNPGPSWHVAGTGDFNGDGHADILWQNDDGQAGIWLMNGANPIAQSDVGQNPGPDWHVVGAGDVNGDGKSDILWQNDDGQAGVWLMDGTTATAQAPVGDNPGADWHLKGSGDFNGDGKADFLWQNDNGLAGVWLMDGTSEIAQASVAANPGTAWHAIGTGDFNGDGKADILWQNSDNGQAGIWLMNGTTQTAQANINVNQGADWHALGTADFNGDGKADILWQNDNGQAGIWLMDGMLPTVQVDVGLNPDILLH